MDTAAKRARFRKELINAVNPRLALYTRAGLLATTILLLNYAVVGGLATVLMQVCSEITTVEASEPESRGDFKVYEGFINKTLAREQVVSAGGVTITTTVAGCAKRSTATIVAPWFQTAQAHENALPGTITPPREYVGSGITAEVPCWNQYLPCQQDSDSDYLDDVDSLSCSWYRSHMDYGDTYYSDGAGMAAKAERFPWCSAQEEAQSRTTYISMQTLTSGLFGGGAVDMSVYCGINAYVYPGGVMTPSLSVEKPADNIGTLTSFTTYWDLTVTTTTKTCPTFAAAFANSFAFAAQARLLSLLLLPQILGLVLTLTPQCTRLTYRLMRALASICQCYCIQCTQIEIVLTVALIYIFKMRGIIKDAEGVLDLGDHWSGGRPPLTTAHPHPPLSPLTLAPHFSDIACLSSQVWPSPCTERTGGIMSAAAAAKVASTSSATGSDARASAPAVV